MRAVEKLLMTKRQLAHLSRDYAPVAMYQTFCAEDIVLAHLIFSDLVHTEYKNIQMFTIDSGRTTDDVYLAIENMQQRYGYDVLSVYHPDGNELEAFDADSGFGKDYFQRSIAVRFNKPLKRALEGKNAWISTGTHGQYLANKQNTHSLNRDKPLIRWDNNHQLPCFNPLVRWTQDEIIHYARHHGLPLLDLETTQRNVESQARRILDTESYPAAAVGLG